MRLAAELGADRVELYTEPYAAAFARGDRSAASRTPPPRGRAEAGLGVNAGHDLNLDNLPPFVGRVPRVLEVSIGPRAGRRRVGTGHGRNGRRYLRAAGN
jgi:pyridoxine 5-phosphate synthase